MKFIPKELKNEPSCLRDYRNTEGAKYQSISGLNEALLIQQGHICAYCLRRISVVFKRYSETSYLPQVGVEHIESQESYPDKQLDYRNLVAVCNGCFGEANPAIKPKVTLGKASKNKENAFCSTQKAF